MNMKDMIQRMTEIEAGKTVLNESVVDECGSVGMPATAPTTPPSMTVSLNASGIDNIQSLLRLMKDAGLEKPEQVTPITLSPRLDMERMRDIVDGPSDYANEPNEEYNGVEDIMSGGTDLHAEKDPADLRVKDPSGFESIDDEVDEWANEPEEEYSDHNTMINTLSGGINRKKRQFKASQRGDNAMSAESLKDSILNALEEEGDEIEDDDSWIPPVKDFDNEIKGGHRGLGSNGPAVNGKPVNTGSIEVDGVDPRDYPDFSDAYISYAEYEDGTPLSDQELDALTDQHGDIVNQLAHDSMH